MSSSFTAYIDESGDEGFTFKPDRSGSSEWFVLSAVLFRTPARAAPLAVVDRARAVLGKTPAFVPHFTRLKHDQRIALMVEVAKAPFRTISVLVHKPSIPEPERYQSEKFMLYRYVTRLLLERVSWLCRDHRQQNDGDGTVDLVFSDRAAMSYEDLRSYLERLRQQSINDERIKVHWPAIVPSKVRAVAHAQLAGLQIADAVASSAFQAVMLGRYGQPEPRYFEFVSRHLYRHKGRTLGYGLKFWPDRPHLLAEMPHLAALGE